MFLYSSQKNKTKKTHTHKPKEHPHSPQTKETKKELSTNNLYFQRENMKFGLTSLGLNSGSILTSYEIWENNLTFSRPSANLGISDNTYTLRSLLKKKIIKKLVYNRSSINDSWYFLPATGICDFHIVITTV